jgi:hypothetical protein
MTYNVLDTAEALARVIVITNLIYLQLYIMDPRRARDPRLARADPRLQRQTETPPAPPVAAPYPGQFGPNGNVPDFQGFPPSVPEQDVKPAFVDHAVPGLLTGEASYKARPTFCVVCASNNVCVAYNHSIYVCLL